MQPVDSAQGVGRLPSRRRSTHAPSNDLKRYTQVKAMMTRGLDHVGTGSKHRRRVLQTLPSRTRGMLSTGVAGWMWRICDDMSWHICDDIKRNRNGSRAFCKWIALGASPFESGSSAR